MTNAVIIIYLACMIIAFAFYLHGLGIRFPKRKKHSQFVGTNAEQAAMFKSCFETAQIKLSEIQDNMKIMKEVFEDDTI